MKKYAVMVVGMLLMIGLFMTGSTLAEEQSIEIGISIPTADHGWTAGVLWWARHTVEEWKQKDSRLEFFLMTADSPAKQIGDVEDLMVKGIDVLIILPHNSVPLTPVVEEAYNSGIYTIVVDRGLTKDVQHVYVAGDNPGLGRISAEWMAQEMDGKGKMVVLEGIPCVINTERIEAFNAVMKHYPDIEILDSQPAYWQAQKGLEIMENYLQKHDHIDAVWAQDDDILKGVLQAYKESGRNDISLFLGGAGAKDIVKMVMDGDPLVRADVTYPPSMIATAINLAVEKIQKTPLDELYQNKEPSRVILDSELIVPENAKDYYYPDSVF